MILGDVVELFNGVDVLFRLIRYSTEYIDESVKERTAGMIVTAFIELWDVEPDININVVAFSSDLSLVSLLSRSSYYDELVTQRASRVSMTRILQLIFLKKITRALIHEDLVALIHSLSHLVEVSTPNEEKSATWHLN